MDIETQVLAALSQEMERDYSSDADKHWVGSPFAWIRTRPSRQRGAIGERLVSGWFAAKGADVLRSPDAEADRIIEGFRCEIKVSTIWNSGVYKFQQIRDQSYELLICLGLSPYQAHCWILPKSILLQYVIGIMGQHTGGQGQETAWLSVNPVQPLSWLKDYGGTLADAWQAFQRMIHEREAQVSPD
jgi:hypothetical protein